MRAKDAKERAARRIASLEGRAHEKEGDADRIDSLLRHDEEYKSEISWHYIVKIGYKIFISYSRTNQMLHFGTISLMSLTKGIVVSPREMPTTTFW